jgi:uncharacterized protein (DUF1778 family)
MNDIEDEEIFLLDEEKWDQLMILIEAPPRYLPGLFKLMRSKMPWSKK